MRSTRTLLAAMALLTAAALVAACTGSAAAPATPATPTSPPVAAASVAPAPAVTPSPAKTPKEVPAPSLAPTPPPPTPWPATDGQGDEVVGGRDLLLGLTKQYSSTRVGDVDQLRDGQVTFTTEMNDPRVSGTLTFDFGLDVYENAASQWGTMKLVNDGGTWEGPCTGGSWDGGDGLIWSCWLTGSGGYDGWTYYRQTSKRLGDTGDQVVGIVYPGEPPAGATP